MVEWCGGKQRRPDFAFRHHHSFTPYSITPPFRFARLPFSTSARVHVSVKLRAIMDWLVNLLWHDGKLLGIEWHFWKVVGWLGNAVFFSRFFVQWYATEKKKQVVVPTAFWWLSLAGSFLLLAYSLWRRDSVFIFAYVFTWIPYVRNLIIHHRHRDAHLTCHQCQALCPPQSRFCYACGTALNPPENKTSRQKT